MRRCMLAIACVMLAAIGNAGDAKFGGHAAYLVGGELPGDTLGYGGQASAYVNDVLSLEAAVTKFTDDNGPLTIDLVTAAATVRLSGRPAEGIELYVGGGANYNVARLAAAAAEGMGIAPAIGYHYCGGIALALRAHLDLFAEYRQSTVKFDKPENAEAAKDFNENYGFGLVMVGLAYRL